MIYERGKIPEKGPCQWLDFSSLTDLKDHLESAPLTGADRANEGGWADGSHADALRCLERGQPKMVRNSDAFLAKVERLTEGLVTSGYCVVPTVAGGAANVPAYLSGHPLSMRRRVRVVTETKPVVILSDVWVSASVGNDTIVRRGAAAMALARVLSANRPVTLALMCGHGPSDVDGPIMWSVPIDTAPLDLSRASWALQSPQMLRLHGHRLLYRYTRDTMGLRPYGDEEWQRNEMAEHFAARRGYGDEYIALPDASEFSSDEIAIDWVQSQISAFQDRQAA